MLDPLGIFLDGIFAQRGLTTVPLVSTDHDVLLASGLAVVTTRRLFRNVEPGPIEAALTFPLPVHATLFELTADIDGRRLHAEARERVAARQTYESAVADGKASVLHEELLRGIHLLSVANIRPGGAIAITTRWAMPLAVVAGSASLRIPQTVGEVYGRAMLADADALATGAAPQPVAIAVRAPGKVEVVGARLVAGRARLSTAAPIDIIADLWEPTSLIGNVGNGSDGGNGQAVALTLSPEPAGAAPLSLAVLVDHSGSMTDGFHHGRSAHDAAKGAIVALAAQLESGDFVDLWEFDDSPRQIGSVGGGEPVAAGSRQRALLALAVALSPPWGGTEIGRAIDAVLGQSAARDMVVITDGLSSALDVQRLARAGRRISVVLVGDSSLEARIGHLAALTGGDIFIATAADLERVTGAAIAALRRRHLPLPPIAQLPDRLETLRNNVRITAQWLPGAAATVAPEIDRAAVAVATSLLVGCATSDLAGKAAMAAGIVSHLTSLVLVDEAGDIQAAPPAFRKVALAAPGAAQPVYAEACAPLASVDGLVAEILAAGGDRFLAPGPDGPWSPPSPVRLARCPLSAEQAADRVAIERRERASPLPVFAATLLHIAYQIDWRGWRDDLVRGDVSALPGDLRDEITNLAAMAAIVAFARRHGLTAAVIAIGLLGRAVQQTDANAKAVWLAIVAQLKPGRPDSFWALEAEIEAVPPAAPLAGRSVATD